MCIKILRFLIVRNKFIGMMMWATHIRIKSKCSYYAFQCFLTCFYVNGGIKVINAALVQCLIMRPLVSTGYKK